MAKARKSKADAPDDAVLKRIASALDRLAPGAMANTAPATGDAFVWEPAQGGLLAVTRIASVPLALLKGIDAARDTLFENTRRFAEGLPLHEALYALILMRRHIWLYAEFQAIFITAVEQHQAVESLTRTILMFDYATYVLAERYEELMRREMNERVKAKKKGEEWGFYKSLTR